ncbi:AMP-binding protein [Roseibium aggregatum]|uniref:AMP-binding protein n=1 Tax=Roseibium aggregatum TaxID=187304 RepID=A0A939J4V3_9HYPH|nr:AMP-binding protein [Roseibium aggregatum]MBN9672012.1 AMP-binding protein [Roseibium aggregatum]
MTELACFVRSFRQKAGACPDKVFATFDGEAITFGDLDRMSDTFAAHLRGEGVRRGDAVAVMMRNSRFSLAILFGLAKAGVVWVPVNAQLKGEGLAYILQHCAARAVICNRDLLETIDACGADLTGLELIVADDTERAGALEPIFDKPLPFTETPPEAQDLFAVMYTSGTTGRPKGVMVTHGMLRLSGEAVKHLSRADDGDVFLVWEPLYHIGGAQLIILPLLADVVLAMVARFSASRFWEQVRTCGATHIHYLGGILQILLKQPEGPGDRSHPVRVAWGGGCPKEIWTAFEERFGVEILECYGMTEASSLTTCNDEGVVGAVGRPMPWFSVEVVDDDGLPVPTGEKGEIVVETSLPGALFKGYLNNREATEKALRDGRLHTGDCGSIDGKGVLWFHGRLTDSVRCKGENVSAFEVETVAGRYPAVEDCALIGVAAEVGEQDIKLFVKPKAGQVLDLQAFSDWLGERLAAYQRPRYLELVEEFERTPSQRIMKHKLSTDVSGSWDRLAT